MAWQQVIYQSDLPDWLQEELINVPSTLAKNSVWLARTRPDDWWGDEGLFLVNESFSATCAVSETMPCRFFGHWVSLFFFPELERIALETIRYFQLRGGEPPFCLGLGFAIPAILVTTASTPAGRASIRSSSTATTCGRAMRRSSRTSGPRPATR